MTLPPKKPRTKPAEERLDDLMNAAEKLFLSKGFVSTTVSEIVLSADVAKGTFYHYFQSKNDIMEALRTRYMDWYLGHIQTALDSQTSACEKLKAWCENSVNTMSKNKIFTTCYFMTNTTAAAMIMKPVPLSRLKLF